MIYVVGIDPGPTPGLVGLRLGEGRAPKLPHVDVVQCSQRTLLRVLDGLWDFYGAEIRLSVEAFQVSQRAGRSRSYAAGRDTQVLSVLITKWAGQNCLPPPTLRRAGEVKPWATDARLAAAELMLPTKGMQHARDAARHALFAAVKDHGLADPLSRKKTS